MKAAAIVLTTLYLVLVLHHYSRRYHAKMLVKLRYSCDTDLLERLLARSMDINDPLEFETLAASLKLDQRASSDLVESLTVMLESALPEMVEVQRAGWLLSKDKPISKVLIKFEDVHYALERTKSGAFNAKSMKVVRGIALKTTDVQIEECLREIVRNLSAVAGRSAAARDALNKFVLG